MRADGVISSMALQNPLATFRRWRDEGASILEKLAQRRAEALHQKEQAERDLAELDEAIAVLGAIGKP